METRIHTWQFVSISIHVTDPPIQPLHAGAFQSANECRELTRLSCERQCERPDFTNSALATRRSTISPMTNQHFRRDAALPFVESRRAADSRACYKPHTHPTFSVGAVDAGVSTALLGGGAPVALGPGDVVLVPPEVVHACNPAAGVWSYRMLYIDADWLRRVAGGVPGAGVVRDPALYAALCATQAVLDADLPAAERTAALADFVRLLVRRAAVAVALPPGRLAALRAEVAARCDEGWTVAALARRVGLSRFQLTRAFRAETGMTPHAWLLDQRVNRARALLRAGAGAAEAAYRYGFADQAHFQRAFKARAAITPGAYGRAA